MLIFKKLESGQISTFWKSRDQQFSVLNVLTAVLQNYINKIIIVKKNPRIYKIFDSNIQLAKVSDQPVQ